MKNILLKEIKKTLLISVLASSVLFNLSSVATAKDEVDLKDNDTAFDGKGGAVHITEISLDMNYNDHKGNYILGYWYHSGDVDEIRGDGLERSFAGNHGLYAGVDQNIFIENKDNNDDQGLNLIGQIGVAPSDRNEIARYYCAGLVYTGLIPNRDEDSTGIGAAFADVSKRYKSIDGRNVETALEVYHKVQLTPWLAIMPDMQIIFNPGGKGRNAVTFGLRSIIKL